MLKRKRYELSDFDNYDRVRDSHKEWVEELLKDGINSCRTDYVSADIHLYCRKNCNEKVSIKRVRELRIKIKNEAASFGFDTLTQNNFKEQE